MLKRVNYPFQVIEHILGAVDGGCVGESVEEEK